MTSTALIIIDMQIGNFVGDSPVLPTEQLLDNVSKLLERARQSGTPVIFVQHDGPQGALDEPGSPGWEIHPRIAPRGDEPVLRKTSPDAFLDTALEEELSELDARRLVICGLQTEYCVDTTVRRAYGLGYEVTLVSDAHGTWNSPLLPAAQIIAHHNQVLGGWFASVQPTAQVQL